MDFQSPDGRFGLRIKARFIHKLTDYCRESDPNETGGILLGHYTDQCDWAIVTSVTGPPPDSQGGLSWFYRGVHGLQALLNRLWSARRHYYLGEWHFHPGGMPVLSRTDISQLHDIAEDPKYECPEPVLLIAGGTVEALEIGAFVFPRGREQLRLL